MPSRKSRTFLVFLGLSVCGLGMAGRSLAPVGPPTYTLFESAQVPPPGSGVRMGIDRDLDGVLDGDEDG